MLSSCFPENKVVTVVIQVRKRFVFGDLNSKECTQRWPAFFYVVDQELLGGDMFLDFFDMLVKYLNGIFFIRKITVESHFPDEPICHLRRLMYMGEEYFQQ
jgi:hypothetical protein